MRADIPGFKPGDTVKVYVKIIEGQKERIQVFQGSVIRKRAGQNRATFTVRKISSGIGVERTFPLHSPIIDKIEIVMRGRVRRSRLYYLREIKGKKARIKGTWQKMKCRDLNSVPADLVLTRLPASTRLEGDLSRAPLSPQR